MLFPDQLHHYQNRAVQHIIDHTGAMLWLDMGLGKTIAALTAFCFLRATGQADKMLVVAPLRVCETVWAAEGQNWSHTKHLRFSKILGSVKKRNLALHDQRADVYLINYENLEWLIQQLEHHYLNKNKPLPFQVVVWDEVSKMKTSTTKRVVAARKILSKVQRFIGLTGTPASNGILDLHGQYLVVDGGQRLGEFVTHFKERFMYQESWSHKWLPFPEAQRTIEGLIHDITLQMDAADYLDMPEFHVNDVMVNLPPKLQAAYAELEHEMFTEFEYNEQSLEVSVFNAAALSNKCRQVANGAVYIEPGNPDFNVIHDLKLTALEEIMEGSAGTNALVAYSFISDLKRILKKFPYAVNLSGISGKKLMAAVEKWNRGEIRMLVGHPASMGHGLNLQFGGHTLVWYGLNWSLDLTDQFNARINRQGQTRPVVCHRIIMAGTIEEGIRDALEAKCHTEKTLKNAIRRYALLKWFDNVHQ